MKLNWGWGIGIFYSSFVVAMLYMVMFSTQNKVHLVQEKYYNKDLDYESFRQKRANGISLKDQFKVYFKNDRSSLIVEIADSIQIQEGEVHLFRPSSKFEDQRFKLRKAEGNNIQIPLEKIKNGLWKVKVEFTNKMGTAYYKEISFVK